MSDHVDMPLWGGPRDGDSVRFPADTVPQTFVAYHCKDCEKQDHNPVDVYYIAVVGQGRLRYAYFGTAAKHSLDAP